LILKQLIDFMTLNMFIVQFIVDCKSPHDFPRVV
jgi:hypothetical protein